MPPAKKPVRKVVALEVAPEMHAAWTSAAKKSGVSLRVYVTHAVEEFRSVGDHSTLGSIWAPRSAPSLPTVDPAKCTARVRAGSYCRRCAAIHTKGI